MAIEKSTTQPTNGDTRDALSRTVNQFMELQGLALAAQALVIQLGGESTDVGATAIGMLARLSSKATEFSSVADAAALAALAAGNETPSHTREDVALTATSVNPNFTAGGDIYQFHPEAKIGDIEDQISAKQRQLEAMLYVGSQSKFDNSPDTENFFWGCRMAAEEINALTRELVRRLRSGEEVTA